MAKFAGRSAVLKRGDGQPTEVFNTVTQVGDIGAFGAERELIDASSYGDEWKDFVLGQKDGSELTFMLQFDPTEAEHAGLQADFDNSATRNFQVEFPDVVTTFQFPAIVRAFTKTPALDGLWQAEVVVKIVNPGVTQV